MTALSIQPAYPIFTDTDGTPLDNGYIWLGAANLPPQTNPIVAYWDAALTIPAAQPIRTINGYPSNSGTPGRLYVNGDYSILVQSKNGSQVYLALTPTERFGDNINAVQIVYTPAGTGAVATTVQAKLRETVSVKDFGAVGDGVADDTVAIQAALNNVRDTGNALSFPSGTYKVTSTLTLLRNTINGPEQYVIEGNGATLDFSSFGLTSGSLFSLGATSQANGHDTGLIDIADLRIIGPETGAPFAGDTPATSVVGLSLEYALNITLRNIYVQGCYIGVKTNFVFPLRAIAMELKANYIGVYLDDDTTLATWLLLSVTSARYGLVARPSTVTKTITDQHFITPRFEQCLVGAALDPRDGSGYGIRSLVFDSPYLESITYDYFRMGLAWTFANPQTRNADATRGVIWTRLSGGLWDGVNWTGTKAPLVLSSSGSVRSSEFAVPAARVEVVGSISNSFYRSLLDAYVGDTSPIVEYNNAQQVRNNQPGFSAYVNAQVDDVTGDGTAYDIICNTEDYDVASDYNTSTGEYTARFTGRHLLFGKVYLGGITASHTTAELQIVTSLKTIHIEFNPYAISSSGEASYTLQWPCQMTAGNTAKLRIKVNGGTKVVDVKAPHTGFSGYFLG
jgi:hypothetical protein